MLEPEFKPQQSDSEQTRAVSERRRALPPSVSASFINLLTQQTTPEPRAVAGLSSGSWEELTAQGEGATGKAETEDQGRGGLQGWQVGAPAPVEWATINAGTKAAGWRLYRRPQLQGHGEKQQRPPAQRQWPAGRGGRGWWVRQGRALQDGQTLQELSGSKASPGPACHSFQLISHTHFSLMFPPQHPTTTHTPSLCHLSVCGRYGRQGIAGMSLTGQEYDKRRQRWLGRPAPPFSGGPGRLLGAGMRVEPGQRPPTEGSWAEGSGPSGEEVP